MTDEAAPGARRPGGSVLFALLGTALALSLTLAYTAYRGPVGAGPLPAVVHIRSGSDLRQIARTLHEAGVVAHPSVFVAAVRLAGLERRLQGGSFRLDPAWDLPTLLNALLEGRGRTVPVTIPEGWRLEQIGARLQEAGVVDAGEFLAAARDPEVLASLGIPGPSAEGFLFPETYSIAAPSAPEEVIGAMHRQFERVWGELLAEGAAPTLSPLEAVTLASLVEKETAAPEERPLVAAVFLNRLRRGMPLQSDPTVIYGAADFDGNLTRRDLTAPTPYNTYVIRGLPPGPIAAPGKAALRAVLHPAGVEYLFFVSRNDGTHAFSVTLEEHNRAVQRYQLAGRSR